MQSRSMALPQIRMTPTSLIIFTNTVVHLVFLLGSAQQSDMKDIPKVDLLWRLFMIISGNEEVQLPILAVLDWTSLTA